MASRHILSIEQRVTNWLSQYGPISSNKESGEPILFWRTKEVYGCFSNMAPYALTIDGTRWRTVEHYFQAQKIINHEDYIEKIRQASSPMMAKRIGSTRRHAVTGETLLRPDWEEVKDRLMREAVLAKFTLNWDIRHVLLGTESRIIMEDSPKDYYWGIGADGTGENKLGLILMDVREQLQRAETDGRPGESADQGR